MFSGLDETSRKDYSRMSRYERVDAGATIYEGKVNYLDAHEHGNIDRRLTGGYLW